LEPVLPRNESRTRIIIPFPNWQQTPHSTFSLLHLSLSGMAVATQARPTGKKVLLMGTCLCDAFYDEVARATVEVLEYLGVEVFLPENQTCCGQPAFNSGDWEASR